MSNYLKLINTRIILLTIFAAIIIFGWVELFFQSDILKTIRLTQIYALFALSFIYLAILIKPLCQIFKNIPYKERLLKTRLSLLISAVIFALLHEYFAFFKQLGGFEGLFYLSSKYLIAISVSLSGLFFLLLVIAFSYLRTSKKNQEIINLLTYWFLYLSGILILIHALLLGTHFQDLSGIIPQLIFVAVGFLLILDALLIDKYLKSKFKVLPAVNFATCFVVIFLGFIFVNYINPINNSSQSFGIHAQHIKQAQNQNLTKYKATFTKPSDVVPNENVKLSFDFTDTKSGKPALDFEIINDKLLHLVIVDESLNYYTHIHPVKHASKFSIDTSFPKNGRYHLYIDFLPKGSVEQNQSFVLDVGNSVDFEEKNISEEDKKTNVFSNYTVSINNPELEAKKMNLGEQSISFELKDENGKQVKTLKPYLGAFGHMVMINKKTYDYIHVHPDLSPQSQGENGGPKISFTPLPIYGPIKSGDYRIFTQFNPDNKLILTVFDVKVK